MPVNRITIDGVTYRLRNKFEMEKAAQNAKKKLKKTHNVRIIPVKNSRGQLRHGLYARPKK